MRSSHLAFLLILCIIIRCSQGKASTCKCTDLIQRDFLTVGHCGECARCWWNLYKYSDTFQAKDPYLNPGVSTYLGKTQECAAKIPYPVAFEEDVECAGWYDDCQKKTSEVFEDQCLKIYGPGNPEVLPKPDDRYIAKWKNDQKFNRNKQPPKFTGKEEFFYPRTCPVYHRKYLFTYYLLYQGAFKKYGITPVHWDEYTSIPAISLLISKQARDNAAADVKSIFARFGLEMNKRRFCNNPEVFVCVD